MKYFCKNAPQYHIACAGSLLGIALAKPSSFPVGKINFMQIDPMTFTEFLLSNRDENWANYLNTISTIEPIPDAFFNPLYEKLKMYYVTGGMPESDKMWTEARDVDAQLVHKICRSTAPGLPIAAYDDLSAFKIYLVDMGLLRRLAQLAPTAFGEGNRLFTEFKGALTENFVFQTLIT